MTAISLYDGDNRIALAAMIARGEQVDSVVTDAPYGLTSIAKRFGKEGAAPARTEKNDGSFARLSGGFLGKSWDGTGIERDPEFWKLVLGVLKPGGYCFAFSGSRTGHWQAVAMEQAGFVMHPMHGWVFGSGLPKHHSAREAGPEWEGWAYGTQAQKPALEPIYLGQKPFSEKTGIKNIRKHGVGAVNIDGCRVPTEDNLNGGAYAQNPTEREAMWGEDAGNSWRRGGAGEYQQPAGRHPANLIHDGSAEVIELFPNGSNRFFNCFPPDADPVFYNPKAGKEDRAGGKHPTVKPVALMQHLIRHVTPPGGVVLDPFAGSGTTAEAARREGFDCILMEAEPEYIEFLKDRFQIAGVEDDLLAPQMLEIDPLQELLG